MILPKQMPTVLRTTSPSRSRAGISPSGCDVFKAIRCAASVAACVAACAGGPAACISCFAAVGASDCIDCI